MSDLDIQIKLDPAPAVTGAKAVTSEVAKTEKAAKGAEGAFDRLAESLQDAGTQQQRVAQQANAASGSMSSLGKAGGFALDQLASFAGPAAIFAGLTAAVSEAAGEFVRLQRETTAAANAILKFEGTQEKARANLQAYRDLSATLNATLGEGIQAYDAIEGATSRLLLTQQQQMTITRNLGQTLIADGGSLQDLIPVMERLEYAIEKNVITGAELDKMMRKNPEIAKRWQEEYGMTAVQLVKAADSGKLVEMGLGRLVTTFGETSAASKLYAERVLTIEDAQKRYGSSLGNTVKGMAELYEAQEKSRESMITWTEAFRRGELQVQRNADAIEKATTATKTSAQLIVGLIGIGKAMQAATDGAAEAEKRNKAAIDASNEAKREAIEIDKLRALIFDAERTTKPGSNSAAWEQEQAGRSWEVAVLDADSRFEAGNKPDEPDLAADMAAYDARQAQAAKVIESTKKWNAELQKSDGLWNSIVEEMSAVEDLFMGGLVNAAGEFSGLLVDAAHGADVSWSEFGKNTMRMFGEMLVKAALLQAITGSVTGSTGAGAMGGYGGLLGLLGGATGLDATMSPDGLRKMPAFATGGDAMVGGAGGTDSRIAMIRVTPGESIHVRTPQQQQAAGAQSSTPGNVRIVNQYDPRGMLDTLGSSEGERMILNVIRRNQAAVKSLTR